MKEIREEVKREVVETHVYYEATDGTRFHSSEECGKYEDSALGMLRGKVSKLFVSDKKSAWDVMGGYEDSLVVALSIPTEKDLDTVIQWMYLEWPYMSDDSHKDIAKKRTEIAREVYEQKDVLLLGINDSDDYYFINSRNNIVANLTVLGKEESHA